MGSILSQLGSKLGQCSDALAQLRERFVTYELGSQDRRRRNGMQQEPGLASELRKDLRDPITFPAFCMLRLCETGVEYLKS
jgi:hypothetical protein